MDLSENIEKRRKQQKNLLIFITCLFIVLILFYGVLYFIYNDFDALQYLIGAFILFLIFVIFEWKRYFYQKKIDTGFMSKKKNLANDFYTTVNKASGVNHLIHSSVYFVIMAFMLVMAIYSFIVYDYPMNLLGIVLIIIALILLYAGINDSQISDIRNTGRYY